MIKTRDNDDGSHLSVKHCYENVADNKYTVTFEIDGRVLNQSSTVTIDLENSKIQYLREVVSEKLKKIGDKSASVEEWEALALKEIQDIITSSRFYGKYASEFNIPEDGFVINEFAQADSAQNRAFDCNAMTTITSYLLMDNCPEKFEDGYDIFVTTGNIFSQLDLEMAEKTDVIQSGKKYTHATLVSSTGQMLEATSGEAFQPVFQSEANDNGVRNYSLYKKVEKPGKEDKSTYDDFIIFTHDKIGSIFAEENGVVKRSVLNSVRLVQLQAAYALDYIQGMENSYYKNDSEAFEKVTSTLEKYAYNSSEMFGDIREDATAVIVLYNIALSGRSGGNPPRSIDVGEFAYFIETISAYKDGLQNSFSMLTSGTMENLEIKIKEGFMDSLLVTYDSDGDGQNEEYSIKAGIIPDIKNLRLPGFMGRY